MLLYKPVQVLVRTERDIGTLSSTSVIYDVRFGESEVFAEAAIGLGARARGIRGDVTELWCELSSRRFGAPGSLVGLTQESDFFLLHQICIEQGGRLAYYGEHTYHSGGAPRIEHRLRAPAQLADAVKVLTKSGENWPRAVADIVSRAAPGQQEDVAFVFDAPLVRPTLNPGHLVSWAILPS
jgi:hypothetical protein